MIIDTFAYHLHFYHIHAGFFQIINFTLLSSPEKYTSRTQKLNLSPSCYEPTNSIYCEETSKQRLEPHSILWIIWGCLQEQVSSEQGLEGITQ